jgi:ornithine cyclodeaminase
MQTTLADAAGFAMPRSSFYRTNMTIVFYDAAQVEELLDYPGCIGAMRQAMIALSSGARPQPLRQIFTVGNNDMFGTMPGELAALSTFGAKLISVFADPDRPGRTRHQGIVVAYDGMTGAVSCIADAEPVTKIRTACATAAATDALARADADVLAIFGTGLQAESHLRALPLVRPFREILLWGQSPQRARELAERMSEALDRTITPIADGQVAASRANVICTVTSSAEPVLLGDWVKPGTHVNLVGSSYLGPVEVDSALVEKARYFADYRPGVLAQAAELAAARDAGVIDDTHLIGEIGDVLSGHLRGRQDDDQITIYKSLGHVVQDLAAAAYLHGRASVGRE